jgi:type I restriction enzyme, S subunit
MSVPKLRFPEFIKAGAWKEKKLEELGCFTGGGTPSKEQDIFWKGTIPWISSSDISEDSIYQINISRFITEGAIRESATKLVPANSILLISRVGVGKLAITEKPVCTSQDFTNFTPDLEN